MSNNNIEQMKKLIEEKKEKSSQQGIGHDVQFKKNVNRNKAFKNTKRGGALNKQLKKQNKRDGSFCLLLNGCAESILDKGEKNIRCCNLILESFLSGFIVFKRGKQGLESGES